MAPWPNGAEFGKKHWNGGTSAQKSKAARIATAVLASGAPEGIAIATGIARAKGQPPKRRR